MLDDAGLLGVRAAIHHGPFDPLPYNPYFANLIVWGEPLGSAAATLNAADLYRVLRPCGGVACQIAGGDSTGATRTFLAGGGVPAEEISESSLGHRRAARQAAGRRAVDPRARQHRADRLLRGRAGPPAAGHALVGRARSVADRLAALAGAGAAVRQRRALRPGPARRVCGRCLQRPRDVEPAPGRRRALPADPPRREHRRRRPRRLLHPGPDLPEARRPNRRDRSGSTPFR